MLDDRPVWEGDGTGSGTETILETDEFAVVTKQRMERKTPLRYSPDLSPDPAGYTQSIMIMEHTRKFSNAGQGLRSLSSFQDALFGAGFSEENILRLTRLHYRPQGKMPSNGVTAQSRQRSIEIEWLLKAALLDYG
ncbi:MAG: hypothetical protein Q9221_005965 [Calogaya cf. arnoldii]